MRKRHFLLLAFAITGLALNGCSGGGGYNGCCYLADRERSGKRK